MKRSLYLMTKEIADRIIAIEDWWWRCGHCGAAVQGGKFGIRAHIYVVHPDPRIRVLGEPAEEMNQCKNNSSSMVSRPSLRVVSSSPTPASPETSARTD